MKFGPDKMTERTEPVPIYFPCAGTIITVLLFFCFIALLGVRRIDEIPVEHSGSQDISY